MNPTTEQEQCLWELEYNTHLLNKAFELKDQASYERICHRLFELLGCLSIMKIP